MLMALGLFVFERATLPFSELQHRSDWRHPRSERVGAAPVSQFLGPGGDDITLNGICVPEMGGSYASIETLREMAATGESWPLVEGTGRVLGNYCIIALDTQKKAFIDNGMPRKIDFAIDLQRTPDD